MTRLEKDCVLQALRAYAEQSEGKEANLASAIAAYWQDIVDLPAGSVKI